MRRRTLGLVVAAIVLAIAAPGADALIRCFAYPDATIVDPGPGQPSYCGGSGDGCIHCYEVVVVP
ncbi:MAG: hypothetical protein HRF46_01010 [Acidobacteriota bacterium]